MTNWLNFCFRMALPTPAPKRSLKFLSLDIILKDKCSSHPPLAPCILKACTCWDSFFLEKKKKAQLSKHRVWKRSKGTVRRRGNEGPLKITIHFYWDFNNLVNTSSHWLTAPAELKVEGRGADSQIWSWSLQAHSCLLVNSPLGSFLTGIAWVRIVVGGNMLKL